MSISLYFKSQNSGSIYLDIGISNTNNIINDYEFLVDTGASITTISFKLLTTMGYNEKDLLKNTPVGGMTANNHKITVYPIMIPSILIGDITINNFPIYTSTDLELSNLLGTDILNYFNFNVSYTNNIIVFEKREDIETVEKMKKKNDLYRHTTIFEIK